MTEQQYEKIESAIHRFVEAMTLKDMTIWITDELDSFYKNKADEEQIDEFLKAYGDVE